MKISSWHLFSIFVDTYIPPSEKVWQPTAVLLPGKSHGWRRPVGCSPWGLRVGHDWATSLSLSFFGEGNGNPLHYSCMENPRDAGAWWAAVYGVAQSQTGLKRLSSSSSSILQHPHHSSHSFISKFYPKNHMCLIEFIVNSYLHRYNPVCSI